MKLSIGIDVSKQNLDVAFFNNDNLYRKKYSNTDKGIKHLINDIEKYSYSEHIITMEATGTYHLLVAKTLYHYGFKISVLNPLIIKKYAEMKMLRAKTDMLDAKIISEYGYSQKPALYKPKSKEMELVLYLSKAIEDLNCMKTENKNRLEALRQDPDVSNEVLSVYKSIVSSLDIKIKKIEKRIHEKLDANETYKLLRKIPGVGKRIAPVIISTFGNFEDFVTAKQVASFIGVNPSPCKSGTSTKGRGAISRKGNPYLRGLVYMGSLSALKYNKSCKDLYERLLLKGKDKKLALIAVSNKLVRQIFAVAKYGREFEQEYHK